MRKNKKGFTLIELLAVIVILAIIALIATPIIMNVINDSRKGAAQDSGYGYVKAVELAEATYILKNNTPLNGTYETKDGNLYSGDTKALDVTFKGTKPDDGGTVTIADGEVTGATLTFGGYDFSYTRNGGSSNPSTTVTYQIGDKVGVKGLSETFHVMKQSGNNVLLLCDTSVASTAFYGGSVHDQEDQFSGSTAEEVLNSYTATWKTNIEGASGNTMGLTISIPSVEELRAVRAHYEVTDDNTADDIDWLALSDNSAYFTKTPAAGAGFDLCIVVYDSASHKLAGTMCAGSSYEKQVRPTLLIHASNLTKIDS